jgi:hypothetical protein
MPPWSGAEIRTMLNLWSQGKSPQEISKVLPGRTPRAINEQRRRRGLPKTPDPAEAYEREQKLLHEVSELRSALHRIAYDPKVRDEAIDLDDVPDTVARAALAASAERMSRIKLSP